MRKVTALIDINCQPRKIIDAFLQPQMLKEWWNVDNCLIQPQSGGVYALAWNINNEGIWYISSGIITIYQPGIMLVIEKFIYLNPEHAILGPMTLVIKISMHNNITTLNVTQDGYKEGLHWNWYLNETQNAWPQLLNKLKANLEEK